MPLALAFPSKVEADHPYNHYIENVGLWKYIHYVFKRGMLYALFSKHFLIVFFTSILGIS